MNVFGVNQINTWAKVINSSFVSKICLFVCIMKNIFQILLREYHDRWRTMKSISTEFGHLLTCLNGNKDNDLTIITWETGRKEVFFFKSFITLGMPYNWFGSPLNCRRQLFWKFMRVVRSFVVFITHFLEK